MASPNTLDTKLFSKLGQPTIQAVTAFAAELHEVLDVVQHREEGFGELLIITMTVEVIHAEEQYFCFFLIASIVLSKVIALYNILYVFKLLSSLTYRVTLIICFIQNIILNL
jgi:hypothetical protein